MYLRYHLFALSSVVVYEWGFLKCIVLSSVLLVFRMGSNRAFIAPFPTSKISTLKKHL